MTRPQIEPNSGTAGAAPRTAARAPERPAPPPEWMTPLQRSIEVRGGLIKTAELHTLDMTRGDIAAAVSHCEIQRIRQGWYANPWLPAPQSRAARVGGQLTCASAAAALGMWQPAVAELHVAVAPHARALRDPASYRTALGDHPGVVVHWSGRDPLGTRVLVSPWRCITQLAECTSPEVALAVAESALHRGVVGRREWDRRLAELPRRLRRLLGRATPASETGSESILVFRMARLGVIVRQQVVIEGVGRVDGLIGERLVIEIDSRAHHGDPEPDRRRDARLGALGYRVIRVTYHQIMHAWPEVEAHILAAIARGDHLAPAA